MNRRGFTTKLLAVAASASAVSLGGRPASGQTHEHGSGHQHGHRFDDIEHWVKVFEEPGRSDWQKPDEVLKWIGQLESKTVVDIGCASGYFTRPFAKAVGPRGWAIGAEVEPGFLAAVHQLANKENINNLLTQLCKFDSPNLPIASTDLFFICDTYHHIDHRADYLKQLHSCLRLNGRVVVVDFFKDKVTPFGPKASERLHHDLVTQELEAAGLTVRSNLDLLPYQYVLEATKDH
jgi:ubiquinone/menaquinone biosynthesis C-methylase UbiE